MEFNLLTAIVAAVAIVVGLGLGFLGGVVYRKKVAEAEIGSAEEQAKRIVDDGFKEAETLKKEALLEAKEEIVRQNREFEKEVRDRRAELTRLENRCVSREENLDKKLANLENKEQLQFSLVI